MIAIAVLTRDGAYACSGIVRTPLGTALATGDGPGFDGQVTYAVSQLTACRLNKAAFAVSIIGAFIFIITAAVCVDSSSGTSDFTNMPSRCKSRSFATTRRKSDTDRRQRTTTHRAMASASSGSASRRTKPETQRWLAVLVLLTDQVMRRALQSATMLHSTTTRLMLQLHTLATTHSLRAPVSTRMVTSVVPTFRC